MVGRSRLPRREPRQRSTGPAGIGRRGRLRPCWRSAPPSPPGTRGATTPAPVVVKASRLTAEISSSAFSAAAVSSTRLRTCSSSDEGTYTSRDNAGPRPTARYKYGPCSSPRAQRHPAFPQRRPWSTSEPRNKTSKSGWPFTNGVAVLATDARSGCLRRLCSCMPFVYKDHYWASLANQAFRSPARSAHCHNIATSVLTGHVHR